MKTARISALRPVGVFFLLTFFVSVFAFNSPTPVSAATAFVKLTQANAVANTNTVSTANFSSAVTSGNLMVVWIWYNSSTASVTSVTDTAGNTYSKIIGPTVSPASFPGWSQELWYAKNITGGTSLHVTANFSATFNAEKSIAAHEYSGVDTVNPLDVSAAATGNTANASSGSAVTTSPNELIFGGVFFEGSGAQGSGFTRRSSLNSNVTEDKSVTTTGSNAATAVNTAQGWIAQMATFRAAGSTPPPPDTIAPSVSITAPLNNAQASSTTFAVTASASDNIGVSGVQFLLDGANLGAEDTTAPYSLVWNTTTASNGPHVLSARARDAAGNTGTSASVNVTVDNQAPTGTIAINNGATATNSTAATLNLSATDTQGSVTQMRFSNTGTTFNPAVPYATTASWTLTTGAGTKTVYVQFKDAAGNWSPSLNDTIVVDTTAPTITAVASSNKTNSSATITWTTNEAATSQVEYGLTASYGTLAAIDTNLVTAHSVNLASLASSATYNYRVRSKDAAGNEKLGTNNTFATLAGADTSAPSVPANLVANVTSATQINVSWNASADNVGVTAYNLFRNGSQVATTSSLTFQDTSATPNSTYSYTISARDAAGNVSALSTATIASTPAAVVSNVAVSGITITAATITWTTDQPTTSAIEYGATSSYGSITPENATLTLNHSVTVSGLTQNTLYHFRTHSADATDHHVFSSDRTFTTLSGSQNGTFLNEIISTGYNLPTNLTFLPDGRMLVLDKDGTILVVQPGAGAPDPTPFMRITNIGQDDEQGLQFLALDPNFDTNRFFYVFYTALSPNRDRLSRFTMDVSGTTASLASETIIWQDIVTASAAHHGGAIVFGSDGKLYLATGEHTNGALAQDLTSYGGKVLRLNLDGTVPTDNPFYDGAGPNLDAIYALGLRNPYRMTYDPPTGRIIIGDVGGNAYDTAVEEVELLQRGANYGWPNCEGPCGTPGYTSPIYSYTHFVPGNPTPRDAAITGGFVYRGSQFPTSYQGSYYFADYVQNWIKRLTFDASGTTVTGVLNVEPMDGSLDGPYGDIVSLVQGPEGALYYVDIGFDDNTDQFGTPKIRRIRFISNNNPPSAVASADITDATTAPLTVNFSSAGSSDADSDPLTYSWDFGDGSTLSTAANPTHTYTQTGQYSVRLTVSDGTDTNLANPLLITIGNRPTANILTPTDGALFLGGDMISYSATGSDVEDGTLPDSAFVWNIDFLHSTHVHPGVTSTGRTGTFTIPTTGHDFSGNTRYQFKLTVTDSSGLKTIKSVVVYPNKVNLTFTSNPSGQIITLDGLPHTTPFVYDTLPNFVHTIAAVNGSDAQNVYTFASWSDNGVQSHSLTVPNIATTYSVNYVISPNTTPITIGEPNIASTNDSGNGNLLLAQKATLSQTSTLQSLSFYVRAAGGNLRLGLYDATGPSGNPGTKKAETLEFTPIVGWNTVNVVTPVSLPTGNYWLAYLPQSNALGFQNENIGQEVHAAMTYGALPASFPTSVTSSADQWSFYGTLLP